MKKTNAVVLLVFSLLIIRCGTARAQTDVITSAPGPYWLDLREVGINAKIKVPATAKIIRLKHGFIIGDGKNFCLEMIQEKKSYTAFITAFEKNKLRKFIKYVQEDDYGFVAEMKVSRKKEFDFGLSVKLGRDYFIIKDSDKFHHPDIAVVNEMYNSAQTITAYDFFY